MQTMTLPSDTFRLRNELRHALTGIGSTISLLCQTPLSANQLQKLNVILTSGYRLITGIEKLIHADKRANPPRAATPISCNNSAQTPPLSILLVEDELVTQFVHTNYLTKMGCSVECATTGAQALQMFETRDYTLVLLDIGLPDMSGIEVCRRMLANKRKSFIPIIAVTVEDEEIATACLEAGVREVICKPISFELLQSSLQKQIQLPKVINT